MTPSSDTRQLIDRIMAALDYGALGEIYCDDGGDAFWKDRREPVVELGLAWADELSRRLAGDGNSLYVGAGVAEIPVLATELCDLGRECVATTLRERECEVLNAAFERAAAPAELRLHCGDAAEVGAVGFDHLALVSVLDDPETFPWVSHVTYGRAAPWSFDVEGFAAERDRVRALVRALLGKLQLPSIVTTTCEEVPWLLEAAEARGWEVATDDKMVETALVGDPLGFLTMREAVDGA